MNKDYMPFIGSILFILMILMITIAFKKDYPENIFPIFFSFLAFGLGFPQFVGDLYFFGILKNKEERLR